MNASATSDNASLLYYCYNCMKAEIITTIVFQLVTDTECKPPLLAWHLSKKTVLSFHTGAISSSSGGGQWQCLALGYTM